MSMQQRRLESGGHIGGETGFSLMETVFALTILLVVATGILPLGILASRTAENQGHLVARTTEYAQDKLEQLMALSYGDTTSDTRLLTTQDTGGTGLTIGGGIDVAAPVNSYVDYLDADGNLFLPPSNAVPANWFYKRVWQISSPRANLKLIQVTATVRVPALGGIGVVPISTVSALKSFPF
jgi:type II secretory pathway pseudopilin PulG